MEKNALNATLLDKIIQAPPYKIFEALNEVTAEALQQP
jgi:hypothetical protein